MLVNIGGPRLSTVQTFFKTESNKDMLGCYAWNQALASALLPLLSDFEISIRNALHKALSQKYGGKDSFNWMLPQANPLQSTSPNAPNLPSLHKMNKRSRDDAIKAAEQVEGKKPGYTATPDDVVGALNFGFWEILIKNLDFHGHPANLQEQILSTVFPSVPTQYAGQHGSQSFKNEIVDRLSRIREVRNRIGHHDALWKHPEFQATGTVGFIPRRPRHTINSYIVFSNRLLELVSWINPEIKRHILSSDHWATCDVLLSRRALALFRHKGGQSGIYRELLLGQHDPKRRHDLQLKDFRAYKSSVVGQLRNYYY